MQLTDAPPEARRDGSPHSQRPDPRPSNDGLAMTALILGVAGFLPLPGLVGSVTAIVLSLASYARNRAFSSAALAGLVCGIVGVLIAAVAAYVYFGYLGYPWPQLQHYVPRT